MKIAHAIIAGLAAALSATAQVSISIEQNGKAFVVTAGDKAVEAMDVFVIGPSPSRHALIRPDGPLLLPHAHRRFATVSGPATSIKTFSIAYSDGSWDYTGSAIDIMLQSGHGTHYPALPDPGCYTEGGARPGCTGGTPGGGNGPPPPPQPTEWLLTPISGNLFITTNAVTYTPVETFLDAAGNPYWSDVCQAPCGFTENYVAGCPQPNVVQPGKVTIFPSIDTADFCPPGNALYGALVQVARDILYGYDGLEGPVGVYKNQPWGGIINGSIGFPPAVPLYLVVVTDSCYLAEPEVYNGGGAGLCTN